MSILSKEPDGLGYYYGFVDGDARQINVKWDGQMHDMHYWSAYVGGERLPTYWANKMEAESAAIKWAKENPDGQ